jgi:hypothetical protein
VVLASAAIVTLIAGVDVLDASEVSPPYRADTVYVPPGKPLYVAVPAPLVSGMENCPLFCGPLVVPPEV